MRDVNIPLPDFVDEQIAEIEVKINDKKRQYNFRVDAIRWEPDDEDWTVDRKIKALRDGLERYDKSWELIQIFETKDESKFVQALHRQKGAGQSAEYTWAVEIGISIARIRTNPFATSQILPS
jgi:hypothetical protein